MKTLYDSFNIILFFEEDGLRITGGRKGSYCYLAWENLLYGYYVKSYRGHLFLLLSPTVLGEKQVKAFVNRGARSSILTIDDTVVIYVDATQDLTQIKEVIRGKCSTEGQY